MNRPEEVGTPNGMFGEVHPLVTLEETALLLKIDQGDDRGRLLQLCQDRFRRRARDGIAFKLVYECRRNPVVDFIAKTQYSRPLGTPCQRPRRFHEPNALELPAGCRTPLIDLASMACQMRTLNAGWLRIRTNLAGWNRQANATGVAIAATALLEIDVVINIVFRYCAMPRDFDLQDFQGSRGFEAKEYSHGPNSQIGQSCDLPSAREAATECHTPVANIPSP